jgi:Zn-dependent oligopeptidase
MHCRLAPIPTHAPIPSPSPARSPQQELADLTAFAKANGFADDTLSLWDVPFWSERQSESKFGFEEEELRPYFALPNVLDGLFSLCSRIFDVRIVDSTEPVPKWHPDVKFFDVLDGQVPHRLLFHPYLIAEQVATLGSVKFVLPFICLLLLSPAALPRPAHSRESTRSVRSFGVILTLPYLPQTGEPLANFYLDPYARPETKRGGAWMGSLYGRSKVLNRKPVAYLTCNGSPPTGDKPALMTFSEVRFADAVELLP